MFGLDRCNIIQSALVKYEAYCDGADIKPVKNERSNEKLRNIRIIQREGKILTGEDFTPLAPSRAVSACGQRTKSQLIQQRRAESITQL